MNRAGFTVDSGHQGSTNNPFYYVIITTFRPKDLLMVKNMTVMVTDMFSHFRENPYRQIEAWTWIVFKTYTKTMTAIHGSSIKQFILPSCHRILENYLK